MAWTELNWDGEIWDAATGLAAVAEIHMAIKERADCVAHPIRLTDFADDFSGDVWLSEPPSTPGSRQYLKTVLEGFYQGVVNLVEGTPTAPYPDPHVMFTTESAGDTFWTMDALIADIGMGEFADTLLGPQRYSAFLWLREALDRLIYARRMRGIVSSVSGGGTPTEQYAKGAGFGHTTASDAWAAMLADTEDISVFTNAVVSSEMEFSTSFAVFQCVSFTRVERARLTPTYASISGTWTRAEWQVSPTAGEPTDVTISSLNIAVDGGSATACAIDGDTFVAASEAQLPLSASIRNDVSFEIDALPSSLPFDGTDGFRTGLGSFALNIPRTWVYFDIAGELTDQAA